MFIQQLALKNKKLPSLTINRDFREVELNLVTCIILIICLCFTDYMFQLVLFFVQEQIDNTNGATHIALYGCNNY